MRALNGAMGVGILMLAWLGACRTAPPGRLAARHVFGPVIGNEVIAGVAEGAEDGTIVLLVGERALVTVDLNRRRIVRHDLRLSNDAACWGLARLQDGSLWTLNGRSLLAQISDQGDILRQIRLEAPHFDLFAAGDRLLFEPADFHPPSPVLFAARPGEAARVPWSALRSRPLALARASTVVLNLVMCRTGRRGERPCWFPDEAAVSLIDQSGTTRRVPLSGIAVVRPEVLLTTDNPARPVRDAYVDSAGTIWILSSGTPVSGGEDQPGGWILARYSPDGTRVGLQPLAEPARLLLSAEPGRALVLTGAGMVAEVVP